MDNCTEPEAGSSTLTSMVGVLAGTVPATVLCFCGVMRVTEVDDATASTR